MEYSAAPRPSQNRTGEPSRWLMWQLFDPRRPSPQAIPVWQNWVNGLAPEALIIENAKENKHFFKIARMSVDLYVASRYKTTLCHIMTQRRLAKYPSLLMLYSRNTNISGNIIKHNLRTNTLLYKKYISHTLFSKGLMFLWCVRNGWRQGQTTILNQLLLLTIARCVIFKNPLTTSSAS